MRKTQDELVTISCTPQTLACAWLKQIKKTMVYELKGYKRISCDHLELSQGYINNPTRIAQHIQSFLVKHKLRNPYISIGLRGQGIYEDLLTLPTASPDPIDIVLPRKQQQLWDYRYLYPHDNGHAAFYVCSISQSILFQYKLLAFRQQFNLIGITTLSMAYLHAYIYSYGQAFRHSQLGQDMARHNNIIDFIVPSDSVRRSLKISGHYGYDFEHELSTLAPLLGLAISERSVV